jgi:sec-independent protein translocase protein TatA|tara:strand:- start:188 stop:442 length:255 start_codon:yes stop_codon:yes gene_type:complete
METLFLALVSHVEILIVAGIVLFLFGASKIPKLMRSMGSGLGEFKKGLKESNEETMPGEDSDSEKKSPDSEKKSPDSEKKSSDS